MIKKYKKEINEIIISINNIFYTSCGKKSEPISRKLNQIKIIL